MKAQFNIGKAASGAVKVAKAATLTDADMANYVKEYVAWLDKNNKSLRCSQPLHKAS